MWQVLAKSKSVPATEPQWQAVQVASTCGSPLEQRTAPGCIHCPSARCDLGAYCVRANCSNGLIPAGLLAGTPATCQSHVVLFVCAASRHQNSYRSGCIHSSSSRRLRRRHRRRRPPPLPSLCSAKKPLDAAWKTIFRLRTMPNHCKQHSAPMLLRAPRLGEGPESWLFFFTSTTASLHASVVVAPSRWWRCANGLASSKWP